MALDTKRAERRFWKWVRKQDDGCWIWTGGVTGSGYGAYHVSGRQVGAHRFSYQVRYGEIGDNSHICHICENKTCVNPEHLFEGTAEDNMAHLKGKRVSQQIYDLAKICVELAWP